MEQHPEAGKGVMQKGGKQTQRRNYNGQKISCEQECCFQKFFSHNSAITWEGRRIE